VISDDLVEFHFGGNAIFGREESFFFFFLHISPYPWALTDDMVTGDLVNNWLEILAYLPVSYWSNFGAVLDIVSPRPAMSYPSRKALTAGLSDSLCPSHSD
jgi:hypothetical protein